MTIQEMHYDFKMKLNKIDSEQYRNLRIPEIDWKLNEALEIFIKNNAEPYQVPFYGFEKNQRSIDNIRPLVVENQLITLNGSVAPLPDDYMFYVSSYVIMKKGKCKDRKGRVLIKQHDDMFEESPFDRSSYEWSEINATFDSAGLRLYIPEGITLDGLHLTYIRKHAYIHNAQDFLPGSKYKLPNGIELTGRQNCELPDYTHREIVDIAVYIASMDLEQQTAQFKQSKLELNKL